MSSFGAFCFIEPPYCLEARLEERWALGSMLEMHPGTGRVRGSVAISIRVRVVTALTAFSSMKLLVAILAIGIRH